MIFVLRVIPGNIATEGGNIMERGESTREVRTTVSYGKLRWYKKILALLAKLSGFSNQKTDILRCIIPSCEVYTPPL